jgi:outer membrane lipoprotein-sorting protein
VALLFLGVAQPAAAQENSFVPSADSTVVANAPLLDDPVANGIVSRMFVANQWRKEQLQHYTETRTYQISDLAGKLAAQTVVRMDYRAPDVKTFEVTSEKGSGVVRHLVFNRLMNTESETAKGKEHQESDLTPANYKFYLAGEEDLGPYHCYVLRVVPKRKDKYLFEGRIWVDSHDFAIARIKGHPAKNPSFLLESVEFVRDYQKLDEFWLPLRDETHIDVKIYGKRVLTVEHGPYQMPVKPISTSEETP